MREATYMTGLTLQRDKLADILWAGRKIER